MSERLDLLDPIAVLLSVTKVLHAAGLPNAVYGGLALAIYGEPRETRDADLAVAGADLGIAEQALKTVGAFVTKSFERVQFGGNRITRFSLIERDGGAGLNSADLVEPRSERYAKQALARAVTGALRGDVIHVLSPEDFVLFKVLSTRERDLEDAATVLRSLDADLDHAYLAAETARLATELPDHDVVARLAKARALTSP